MFVTVSLLLSEVFHQSFGVTSELAASQAGTKVLAEVALVWVLFADTSRARAGLGLRDFRADVGLYLRLLAGGACLSPSCRVGCWPQVVGRRRLDGRARRCALAPTDAALGASVMTNAAVPERIRRVLNVESGLNETASRPRRDHRHDRGGRHVKHSMPSDH